MLHNIELSLTRIQERMIVNVNKEVNKTNDPLSNIPVVRTFISTKRHTKSIAFNLAERWSIGIKSTEKTIKVTT